MWASTLRPLKGLAELSGDERFAYDSYRRLISMYGRIVKDIDARKFDRILESYKAKTQGGRDTDLTVAMLKDIVADYKTLYKTELGVDFPRRRLGSAFPGSRGRVRFMVRPQRRDLSQAQRHV